MKAFLRRNLLLFFKDKSAMFFSLLAVLIIIVLYLLFLGDVWNESDDLSFIANPRLLMDSWTMGGILAVCSITTTMGAFGIMIEDKSKKLYKDFYASPIKRSEITGGYILSSFIIGVVMTCITLVLAEIYIVICGGQLLSLVGFIQVLGLIVLSTFTNTAIVSFVVSFFKSINAFSTASTILGTLVGFLTGMYVPIGVLPEFIQTVIKVFPVSHSGVLFRQIMMKAPMAEAFAGVPQAAQDGLNEMMGVTFKVDNTTITPVVHLMVLVGTAIIFYLLSLWNLSRKRK